MEEDLSTSLSRATRENENEFAAETDLEERVKDWLESSGKKSELQAKLRAELFGAIQTELAFRGDLEEVKCGNKRYVCPRR